MRPESRSPQTRTFVHQQPRNPHKSRRPARQRTSAATRAPGNSLQARSESRDHFQRKPNTNPAPAETPSEAPAQRAKAQAPDETPPPEYPERSDRAKEAHRAPLPQASGRPDNSKQTSNAPVGASPESAECVQIEAQSGESPESPRRHHEPPARPPGRNRSAHRPQPKHPEP